MIKRHPFTSAFVFFLSQKCVRSLTTIPATLITFDVDGTLVRGSGRGAEKGAHARAFAHSVGRIFGPDRRPTRLPAEVLAPEKYHGSTDGLIALNLAKEALGVESSTSFVRLEEVFREMYDYVAAIDDENVVEGIEPLPGVIDTLKRLSGIRQASRGALQIGLVTGNVEGIARIKMRATGIFATGALSAAASDQAFVGDSASAFLGGFGSDYCSGDIEDLSRNYKDRGEQIALAYRRAEAMCRAEEAGEGAEGGVRYEVRRVVHVGDAPGDVLGAKYCAQHLLNGDAADRDGATSGHVGVLVRCLAVGTGRYAPDELRALAGCDVPGVWESHVLPDGLADGRFVDFCGL